MLLPMGTKLEHSSCTYTHGRVHQQGLSTRLALLLHHFFPSMMTMDLVSKVEKGQSPNMLDAGGVKKLFSPALKRSLLPGNSEYAHGTSGI